MNRRLQLFWAGDKRWFKGTVKQFSSGRSEGPLLLEHLVVYDDGEHKWENLAAMEAAGYLQWETPWGGGGGAASSSSARRAARRAAARRAHRLRHASRINERLRRWSRRRAVPQAAAVTRYTIPLAHKPPLVIRLLACDRIGHWLPAKVVDVRGGGDGDAAREVKVHFKGWSKTHDEWIAVGGAAYCQTSQSGRLPARWQSRPQRRRQCHSSRRWMMMWVPRSITFPRRAAAT